MTNTLNYFIGLSAEQLNFLASSKYGIDRMKILHQLIGAAAFTETIYRIKGFTTTLHPGQAAMSEVELSNRLGYDKKTISRLLDRMNQLGIVTTTQSNRTSVHTLQCLSAWIVDGKRILNPYYVQVKDRTSSSDDRPTTDNQSAAHNATNSCSKEDTAFQANFPNHEDIDPEAELATVLSSFPSFDIPAPVIDDAGEIIDDGSSSANDTEEQPEASVDTITVVPASTASSSHDGEPSDSSDIASPADISDDKTAVDGEVAKDTPYGSSMANL